MQVKTNDGNYDVASKGLGNTALGLGIAGLATSLLGGGASLFNLGRGNNGMTANPSDPDARFVTKSETNLIQENSTLKTELAIQKSENYTDKKMVDVTQYLDGKIRQLENKVDANKDAAGGQRRADGIQCRCQRQHRRAEIAGSFTFECYQADDSIGQCLSDGMRMRL